VKRAAIAAFAIASAWFASGVVPVARAQNGAPNGAASTERRVVDAIAVRFYAPETGGAARPLFITDRMLSFEARIEALTEGYRDPKLAYVERHTRAALEHHVAEEMLSRLPLEPAPVDLEKLVAETGQALLTRIGGPPAMALAAEAEHIAPAEVDAVLRRFALAAIYMDRALSPILHPSDDQLREVYRTTAHPYRSLTFIEARGELERWFVADRVRVAESGYLSTARTRVKILAVAR
jgi:hypothetical protein